MVKVQSFISGAISYLPGGNRWLFERRKRKRKVAGTLNARYCYSVWLRHLCMANRHRAVEGVPRAVAELGPGNSLGSGIAALLSGVETCYAFDLVDHTANENNLRIFEQLVALFRDRRDIPDSKEFPQIMTELDSYAFPADILTDEVLAASLADERVAAIEQDLRHIGDRNWVPKHITYVVPWNSAEVIRPESIDMLFSMSVLEHVDDLDGTYRAMSRWLKRGGFMSHEIDFKCHGHANKWNGHWACSDLAWRMIRGNRPFLLNREPHSTHLRLLEENGFEVVADIQKTARSGIRREELAPRFRNMSDDDLNTYNAFILSRKP